MAKPALRETRSGTAIVRINTDGPRCRIKTPNLAGVFGPGGIDLGVRMTKRMVPVFITHNAGMVSFKGLAVRKSATILLTAVTKIVAIFRSGGGGG
jgi:hypothetical protein